MKRIQLMLAGLVLAVAAAAQANLPPDQVVKQTTDELLSEFTEKRGVLEQDKQKLFGLVNDIVVPHFDMERMARYVLGQYWPEATAEQRKRFVEEFKTQLIRTYATALFEYSGKEEIVYKPFRHEEGERRAVVRTEVPRADGPSIPVEYRLIRNDDEWQVYDVVIENISTVQNYRAQYGTVINARGISGLITALAEKNEKLAGDQ